MGARPPVLAAHRRAGAALPSGVACHAPASLRSASAVHVWGGDRGANELHLRNLWCSKIHRPVKMHQSNDVRARHLYEYSTAAGPLPEPHATGSMKATRMVAIVTKEIWAQRRSHGQARTSARCHERAAARASSPSPGNSCGSEPSAYCTPIHPRRARGAPAQYGDDSKHREGTPDLALV